MSAARVLAYYAQIADAPDAIERLRQFILDLAARGRLVLQLPEEEPASKLLERMAAEKARLAKAGEIRRLKLHPAITNEERLAIPRAWHQARLGDLSTLITKGSTPTSYGQQFTPSGINFLKVESIVNGRVSRDTVSSFISSETHEFLARSKLTDGDILFSIAGTIGTCAIVHPDILPANTNQALAIVRGTALCFVPNFLITILRSRVADAVQAKARGGAMSNVSLEDIRNVVLPLPPFAEQHRIVAKVEELMVLCDRLQAAQAEREATRDRLMAASLARLNAPDPDPVNFANHVRFALGAFSTLTTRSDQIKQLRQTILKLAVRGKLVAPDSNEAPASELLARIEKETERLVTAGRIKPQKPPRKLCAGDLPFAIPSNWEWVRLSFACDVQDPNPSHRMPHYVTSGGVPFISSENFCEFDGINFSIGKRISADTLSEQVSRFPILPGAIGFTRIGTIGKSRFLPLERTYGISHAVCVINPVDTSSLSMRFLRMALSVDDILAFAHQGTRSIGVPDLGMAVIRNMAVPLPPFDEQRRIVAKVDELMELCAGLQTSLVTRDDTRCRLLEALLAEALAPIEKRTGNAALGATSKRAVLAAEVVHLLHKSPTFGGRTKHQKILHLCEVVVGVHEVAGNYYREAAGPYDRNMMSSVERILKDRGWYETLQGAPGAVVKYRRLGSAGCHREEYEQLFGSEERAAVNRLLKLLVPMSTEEAEIVATLAAVWNDFMLEGVGATDAEIVREARTNWAPEKLRIPEARWREVLKWMREHEVVPKGLGRKTIRTLDTQAH